MIDIIVNRTQHLPYSRSTFREIDDVGHRGCFAGFARGVASNVVVAASRRRLGVGAASIALDIGRLLAIDDHWTVIVAVKSV